MKELLEAMPVLKQFLPHLTKLMDSDELQEFGDVLAKNCYSMFCKLKEAGFTEDQAMKLLIKFGSKK